MYGLVKTLDDGKGGKIKLVGNALTFIIYKNYFGKDLLNDIVAFAKNNAGSDTVQKLGQLGVNVIDDLSKLTSEKQEELFSAISGYKFDTEFVLQFIASLIATAQYPQKPDVTDIIVSIPPYWLADNEIITELMEFLSLFISSKKTIKNTGECL